MARTRPILPDNSSFAPVVGKLYKSNVFRGYGEWQGETSCNIRGSHLHKGDLVLCVKVDYPSALFLIGGTGEYFIVSNCASAGWYAAFKELEV